MEQQATDGVVSWQKPAERASTMVVGIFVVTGLTLGVGLPVVILNGGPATVAAIAIVLATALFQAIALLTVARSSPREVSRAGVVIGRRRLTWNEIVHYHIYEPNLLSLEIRPHDIEVWGMTGDVIETFFPPERRAEIETVFAAFWRPQAVA